MHVKLAEGFGGGLERDRVARNIPPRGIEGAVTQIAREEQEVMGDRLRLAAPLGDPVGGERVPKIHQAQRAPLSG